MDLQDATLMLLAESDGHPEVARIAQSAYEDLYRGGEVSYRVLDDLLGEASGKGVLAALRQKYSRAAYLAIMEPICEEIGRQKPVPPYRGPVREP
jgi:hypothetical protein